MVLISILVNKEKAQVVPSSFRLYSSEVTMYVSKILDGRKSN